MLLSTPALVLHTTNYSETSVIAKVFTRQLGVKSYILKGVRSAKGRTKQNLLQPLSYLDMTVYNNPKKQLQYVKEMRPLRQWVNISGDLVRSSLLFFVAEALYKSIKEEEPIPEVFDYVVELLQTVEEGRASLSEIPIVFLLRLAGYLGIAPLDNYSRQEPLFNLHEGRFLAPPSLYGLHADGEMDYLLDEETSTHLHYYLLSTRQSDPCPILSLQQRTTMINVLLEYYRVHLTEFRNFRSHEILHSVLE